MKKISILTFYLLATVMVFSACKDGKQETATTEKESNTNTTEMVMDADGKYVADVTGAMINWEGSKLSGKHNGTISLKEGYVDFKNGLITGGQFTIDMNSITVLDQQGEWKDKLEAHLKGTVEGREDHFFNVPQFPTATFTILESEAIENDKRGNVLVKGNLEMKGVTKPVSFKAISMKDGDNVKFKSGQIVLDRTEWGVNYNSKSVFPNLTDNIVNDEISLSIMFTASPDTSL